MKIPTRFVVLTTLLTTGLCAGTIIDATFDGVANDTHNSFSLLTNASINDGFTVVLTLSASGYAIAITGLQTSGGSPITGAAGTWAETTFDFADFSSTMHAGLSTQGSNGGTVDLASVTDPNNGDTDNDSFKDFIEVQAGSDPEMDTSTPNFWYASIVNAVNYGLTGLTPARPTSSRSVESMTAPAASSTAS